MRDKNCAIMSIKSSVKQTSIQILPFPIIDSVSSIKYLTHYGPHLPDL